ncbi:MAG: valine--tRNA ligase [Deltaproteobacteria bacterium]|nr:valine--tRNA ligase [Deltaproteobacteria bacterium]
MVDRDLLSKAYDPREVEARWYSFWLEKGYFRARDGVKPAFCIVIPPPNVTGSLHMGHALTNTIQDALVRHKRMQGLNTLWLPGTDHAGIATQVVVERELAREGKTRHDLGREAFLARVWKWKEQSGGRITEQLRLLGSSLDWDRERFTMDEGLSVAVREVFCRLYEEGLCYRGTRMINWCPKDRTALSDLEVDHEEGAVGELWSFAYPLEGGGEIVVATTRPETMLGDTAVAVHPDDERYQGLIGKRVRHPLVDRTFPIIGDAILVDPAFGTGAVKVTPAHDWNDFETGKRHGLEEINILELDGRINAQGGRFAGMDRFEARQAVKAALTELGLDRGTKQHVMALGRCQRCESVAEPMISTQWFVRTKGLAAPAIDAVRAGRTVFVPQEWTKTYFHWLENIQDWCISRQLWWGHQIPAWYDEEGDVWVGRDEAEVRTRAGERRLERDPDVLDTWFSSALWPFSTLGWPDRTLALETFYPTSIMETGFDILFFWVARMMMMGLHFVGEPPFRRVYLHGMVTDEHGDKMSKVKGNVIDPLEVIHGGAKSPDFPEGLPPQGADALRMALLSYSPQGRKIALSLKRVEGYRHFCNKLWNAARFALPLLGEAPSTVPQPEGLPDRWILSRLAAVIDEVDGAIEEFRLDAATAAIYQFFWTELCDWYLEVQKPALYGEDGPSKRAAQAVLHHALDTSLRLLHPFMPFITEEIWQKLPRRPDDPEALMIARFPDSSWGRPDAAAEEAFALLQSAVCAVRTIRAEHDISPAVEVDVTLRPPSPHAAAALETERALLAYGCRAKSVAIATDVPRPPGSAVAVSGGIEVLVPLKGLIDPGKERARITRDLAKANKDIESVKRKLSSPAFVEKAPQSVVEQERDRLRDNQARLERLETALALVEELSR